MGDHDGIDTGRIEPGVFQRDERRRTTVEQQPGGACLNQDAGLKPSPAPERISTTNEPNGRHGTSLAEARHATGVRATERFCRLRALLHARRWPGCYPSRASWIALAWAQL
jgi:hypothetical protein